MTSNKTSILFNRFSSSFGTACCASTALHEDITVQTSTRRHTAAAFLKWHRRRLDLGRPHGLVRSDSIHFVRFSFSAFSSV